MMIMMMIIRMMLTMIVKIMLTKILTTMIKCKKGVKISRIRTHIEQDT